MKKKVTPSKLVLLKARQHEIKASKIARASFSLQKTNIYFKKESVKMFVGFFE